MIALASAGAGFLLAVLWFDLMFDVQARGGRDGDLPEDVLASIAGYYRRVTTTAHRMSRLIAIVMLVTLGAIVAQVLGDAVAPWRAWSSLALAAVPILLAGLHTLPAATRLGARGDSPAVQSALARAVLRDHLLCLASIAALLAVQLSGA